jgi:hypothetical protein
VEEVYDNWCEIHAPLELYKGGIAYFAPGGLKNDTHHYLGEDVTEMVG